VPPPVAFFNRASSPAFLPIDHHIDAVALDADDCAIPRFGCGVELDERVDVAANVKAAFP